MPYSFRSEQWLPYPVETVFAFFANPQNLPALMPPWQQARLVHLDLVPPPDALPARDTPGPAGVGSQIVLRLRVLPLLPIRVRWVAEIIAFELNRQFCDRMVRGPFTYWQHSHRVRSVDSSGPGVTVLTDEVEYDLPLGILGHMAHALFVQKRIEAVFAYRRDHIASALARAVSPELAKPSQAIRTS